MEQSVYTFAIGLVIFIESGATHLETVWLKDATDKSTLSNNDLPDELAFDLTRRSETLNLNLRRNHHINPNADVYFAQKLENGKFGLVQSDDVETENLAYYQDVKNGAFVTVRCVKKANEQCDRIINGNVRIGNIEYTLQPAETDFSSRNNFKEGPGVLGRQYIIQVESHPFRYDAFGYRDAAYEMEKNIGEKRMTLTERLKEQLQQKQSSLAVASLSDSNDSTLQRDTSRQLPQIYYVKMAVVIDKGLWDFWHGNFDTFNPRFISMTEKKHIDSRSYLFDVRHWDNETAVIDQPSFSHGMLFTSYKLYRGNVTSSTPAGLCFTGGVCTIGKRMSIVERRAFSWTIRAAAHELAHSLGARHDGYEENEACKPEDGFIMSPSMADNYPGERYNKNNWHFSTCTIKSFKKVLPTKMCLRNVGLYYDYHEYRQFLTNEPGEVFSIDRQCDLTFGRKSILCETDVRDVCQLMRCTDPVTGICMPRYHGGARGTKCGQNMWCIDGRCVPKA